VLVVLILLSSFMVIAEEDTCAGFFGTIKCVLWGDPAVRANLAGEAFERNLVGGAAATCSQITDTNLKNFCDKNDGENKLKIITYSQKYGESVTKEVYDRANKGETFLFKAGKKEEYYFVNNGVITVYKPTETEKEAFLKLNKNYVMISDVKQKETELKEEAKKKELVANYKQKIEGIYEDVPAEFKDKDLDSSSAEYKAEVIAAKWEKIDDIKGLNSEQKKKLFKSGVVETDEPEEYSNGNHYLIRHTVDSSGNVKSEDVNAKTLGFKNDNDFLEFIEKTESTPGLYKDLALQYHAWKEEQKQKGGEVDISIDVWKTDREQKAKAADKAKDVVKSTTTPVTGTKTTPPVQKIDDSKLSPPAGESFGGYLKTTEGTYRLRESGGKVEYWKEGKWASYYNFKTLDELKKSEQHGNYYSSKADVDAYYAKASGSISSAIGAIQSKFSGTPVQENYIVIVDGKPVEKVLTVDEVKAQIGAVKAETGKTYAVVGQKVVETTDGGKKYIDGAETKDVPVGAVALVAKSISVSKPGAPAAPKPPQVKPTIKSSGSTAKVDKELENAAKDLKVDLKMKSDIETFQKEWIKTNCENGKTCNKDTCIGTFSNSKCTVDGKAGSKTIQALKDEAAKKKKAVEKPAADTPPPLPIVTDTSGSENVGVEVAVELTSADHRENIKKHVGEEFLKKLETEHGEIVWAGDASLYNFDINDKNNPTYGNGLITFKDGARVTISEKDNVKGVSKVVLTGVPIQDPKNKDKFIQGAVSTSYIIAGQVIATQSPEEASSGKVTVNGVSYFVDTAGKPIEDVLANKDGKSELKLYGTKEEVDAVKKDPKSGVKPLVVLKTSGISGTAGTGSGAFEIRDDGTLTDTIVTTVSTNGKVESVETTYDDFGISGQAGTVKEYNDKGEVTRTLTKDVQLQDVGTGDDAKEVAKDAQFYYNGVQVGAEHYGADGKLDYSWKKNAEGKVEIKKLNAEGKEETKVFAATATAEMDAFAVGKEKAAVAAVTAEQAKAQADWKTKEKVLASAKNVENSEQKYMQDLVLKEAISIKYTEGTRVFQELKKYAEESTSVEQYNQKLTNFEKSNPEIYSGLVKDPNVQKLYSELQKKGPEKPIYTTPVASSVVLNQFGNGQIKTEDLKKPEVQAQIFTALGKTEEQYAKEHNIKPKVTIPGGLDYSGKVADDGKKITVSGPGKQEVEFKKVDAKSSDGRQIYAITNDKGESVYYDTDGFKYIPSGSAGAPLVKTKEKHQLLGDKVKISPDGIDREAIAEELKKDSTKLGKAAKPAEDTTEDKDKPAEGDKTPSEEIEEAESTESTQKTLSSIYSFTNQLKSYPAISQALYGDTEFYKSWRDNADRAFAPMLGSSWFPSAVCDEEGYKRDIESNEGVAFVKSPSGTYQAVAAVKGERTKQLSPLLCGRNPDEAAKELFICGEGQVCGEDQLCYADVDEDGEADVDKKGKVEPLKGYMYKISWAVTAPGDERLTPFVTEKGAAISFNIFIDKNKDGDVSNGIALYSVPWIELKNGEHDADVLIQFEKDNAFKEVCIKWDKAPMTTPSPFSVPGTSGAAQTGKAAGGTVAVVGGGAVAASAGGAAGIVAGGFAGAGAGLFRFGNNAFNDGNSGREAIPTICSEIKESDAGTVVWTPTGDGAAKEDTPSPTVSSGKIGKKGSWS